MNTNIVKLKINIVTLTKLISRSRLAVDPYHIVYIDFKNFHMKLKELYNYQQINFYLRIFYLINTKSINDRIYFYVIKVLICLLLYLYLLDHQNKHKNFIILGIILFVEFIILNFIKNLPKNVTQPCLIFSEHHLFHILFINLIIIILVFLVMSVVYDRVIIIKILLLLLNIP